VEAKQETKHICTHNFLGKYPWKKNPRENQYCDDFTIIKSGLSSWDNGPPEEKIQNRKIVYHTSRSVLRSCWPLLLCCPLLPSLDPAPAHLDESPSPPNTMRSHYLTLCVSPLLTLASFYNVEFTLNPKPWISKVING
jgi:hypothetical protein